MLSTNPRCCSLPGGRVELANGAQVRGFELCEQSNSRYLPSSVELSTVAPKDTEIFLSAEGTRYLEIKSSTQ